VLVAVWWWFGGRLMAESGPLTAEKANSNSGTVGEREKKMRAYFFLG